MRASTRPPRHPAISLDLPPELLALPDEVSIRGVLLRRMSSQLGPFRPRLSSAFVSAFPPVILVVAALVHCGLTAPERDHHQGEGRGETEHQ